VQNFLFIVDDDPEGLVVAIPALIPLKVSVDGQHHL